MKYYCLGIKGAGMSTLAQILSDLGNEVYGYDDAKEYKFTEEGLEKRNIKIYYDDKFKLDENTIVTYSVALSNGHPEIIRAKNSKAQVKKYNEVVASIIDMFTTISVAGTHGKTTTSSIVKHILTNTIGCNYFVGAGDGYARKDNKYFVIESDEFNRHFLAYKPEFSIITNIEAEHLDCYKDIDDIRNTFLEFANNTKELVIACGDNEEIRKMDVQKPIIYYGFNSNNDVVISNVELKNSGSAFDINIEDSTYHIEVPLYGNHMILNTTAAIIACRKQNIEMDKIIELLKTFKNAHRRFAETVIGDSVIIDDYAHHPTEIKVTIDAARQKYKDKKVIAIFRPNTYSRTRDFKDEFVESLSSADKVYLTDIKCNREKQNDYPNVTSDMIIEKIKDAEKISADTMNKIRKYKGNVICILGCASVDDLIKACKEELEKN